MTTDIPGGLEFARSRGWNDDIMPTLSVVVPFHRDDATPLLQDLAAKMNVIAEPVELVLLDDGSPSRDHFENLKRQALDIGVQVLVVRSNENLGRSGARNLLVALSRAAHLVFLDSDMLPDREDYLDRYFAEIRAGVRFAYGGRSVERCMTVPRKHRLHWYFTRRFEQVPAAVRATSPARYFLSSNFLVHRNLIECIPLDARFKGWGLEDGEWAHRVVKQEPLLHIDNTATHLGLITVGDIRKKYQESVYNYALVLSICPELEWESPRYRIATRLARWHVGGLVKAATARLVEIEWLPLALRVRLLQFYKAALYSSVVA